ncbi:MAG: flippase [Dehalococcoidales bacterium]
MIKSFSADKKQLVSNFFSLSSVEAVNYIFPLITLPYLVRVLGPEKFGLIAFAQAFVQYFVLFTDYGFNLSATRNISIHRNDIEKVSHIFTVIVCVKFCFMLMNFITFSALVFLIPKFKPDWVLYYCCFGSVIGNVLLPIWLFQGMERMKSMAFLNLIAKAIFLIAIFIFVRKQSDYLYVPLLTAIGGIVAGILSIAIAFRKFHIRLKPISVADMSREVKEGLHIFMSTVSTNLYTSTNTFLLGLFTNNTIVGYFSAGEKVVRALIRMFNPVFQSVYPYISKVAVISKDEAIKKIRKLFRLSLYLSVPLFVVIVFFADNITRIILGPGFTESTLIIRILSPLLLIIPAAYIFANLGLLPFRLDKYFLRIYASGALLNVVFMTFFVGILKFSGAGAALSNIITESVLTILMYFVLKTNKIVLI